MLNSKRMIKLICCLAGLALMNCSSTPGSNDGGTVLNGQAKAHGVYPVSGFGMNGSFVLDTTEDIFVCIAGAGGETIGAEGNFLMVMVGTNLDRARYDTVVINGRPRNRVQLSGDAYTYTINNGLQGAPGFQGDDVEILFDELQACTFVVEAIDDDEGGDRWETTIYNASIWPDGTRFTNVSGDSILADDVSVIQGGQIEITIGQ